MAYASWASPNKTSGNGNDTVSWSASEHTGREQRTTTASFTASGVETKTLTIVQSGKTEFVTIDSTAAVAKAGGTVTITGTSNSTKLTFTLTGTNGIGLTLPATYTAAGASTSNGTAITGDPGATQQFSFSITFTGIGENTTINSKTSQLTVAPNEGASAVCDITQAAGDAYLTISPTTITIPAAGTPAQSVSVSSNTNWSIS